MPSLLVREARAAGRDVVAVTFDKASYETLSGLAVKTRLVGLGQAGKVIRAFKEAGALEVAFAGKIDKRVLFENPRFDMRAISILKNLKSRSDDNIMLGIVDELEREGFTVASQEELLKNLMPGAGQLSRRKPTAGEWGDIKFGMKMAKGIAALDIGQTVVIRDKAVVAAEAIEGTDEAIERGGRIAKKAAVVCKVSKPKQDPRFDVPTVGENTIKTMISVKASVLAIEAGKTLVADIKDTVELCDANNIAFVAVEA